MIFDTKEQKSLVTNLINNMQVAQGIKLSMLKPDTLEPEMQDLLAALHISTVAKAKAK